MARNPKRAESDWTTPPDHADLTWEHVSVELLMDIRGELRRIRRVLECENFKEIPAILRGIRAKLPAKKKSSDKSI